MSSRFSFKQFLLFIAFFLVGVVTPLYLNRSVPSSSEKMAVSYNQKAFFEEIAPTVQKVAKSYGVSPSIILAQAALESDYGSNLLAVKYHNLFAIKAQSGQKSVKLTYQTYFLNKWQTKEGRFVVYKSWTDAIYDYCDLLQSGKLHDSQSAYDILVSNKGYKKPAQALQDIGFSSDPDYATKLIKIIETYDLTKYDA